VIESDVLNIKDIPQVAMDAMNDVHRDELQLVNELNAAILKQDNTAITELCQQWLAHTHAHFERENKMMEKYHFFAYHCHHEAHVFAIQELNSVIDDWLENQNLDRLIHYIRQVWSSWYINHIATMDVMTSTFIKQHIDNE